MASSRADRRKAPTRSSPMRAAFVTLVLAAGVQHAWAFADDQHPPDEARIEAAGLRKIEGRHLLLYTDIRDVPEIDRLPGYFDQAYVEWCKLLRQSARLDQPWRVTGCLIQDLDKFRQAGLMPDDLPAFRTGYSRGNSLWWYDQPSDYYRLHLLLHEGTHCFIETEFGSYGPPWYAEGMAELLGTHALQEGELHLGYFPATRDEVPMWGRIKLVREAVRAGRSLSLPDVLAFGPRAHLENEPYGWCWAAAAFLNRHPRYAERFQAMLTDLGQANFNQRFQQRFADDWDELLDEWQVYVSLLEYGYDHERAAIQFAAGQPWTRNTASVEVLADRGWQSSGIELAANTKYRLTAAGRFQVADQPRVWWSEPNGVSIRYYRGRPLGRLLAAVRDTKPRADHACALAEPFDVGEELEFTPESTGTLYFRVNDSLAELADNARALTVNVQRIGDQNE